MNPWILSVIGSQTALVPKILEIPGDSKEVKIFGVARNSKELKVPVVTGFLRVCIYLLLGSFNLKFWSKHLMTQLEGRNVCANLISKWVSHTRRKLQAIIHSSMSRCTVLYCVVLKHLKTSWLDYILYIICIYGHDLIIYIMIYCLYNNGN